MRLLIDMDSITVEMDKAWVDEYYKRTSDKLVLDSMKDWDFSSSAKYPDVLNEILAEEHFFYNLNPIVGATEYIPKLMEKGLDVVFLTQPPRRSDWAVRDKRKWIQKYLPKFELKNLIFAHRKELIMGDVLFDDNPRHLQNWWSANKNPLLNKNPIRATIDYSYNQSTPVEWRFKKETAWKEFYEKVIKEYY